MGRKGEKDFIQAPEIEPLQNRSAPLKPLQICDLEQPWEV